MDLTQDEATTLLYLVSMTSTVRDEIIRAAFRAGLRKTTIATAANLSRATVDRILIDAPE